MINNKFYKTVRIFLLLYVLSISTLNLFAQKDKISIKEAKGLHEDLNEISGAIYWNGYVWVINDGGNGPYLFALDTNNFTIQKRILIENAINTDWEDIAQNETDILIGDIGNNNGSREFIQVYKVSKTSILEKIQASEFSVSARVISGQYIHKPVGKLKKRSHNFDAEALVAIKDKIFIISKNWTGGPANVYMIDTTCTIHPLNPTITLQTDFLVTGADYQEDNIYLCGYFINESIEKVFMARVKPSLKNNTWTVKSIVSFVPITRQVESIALMPNNRVFIAFERLKAGPLIIPNGAIILPLKLK